MSSFPLVSSELTTAAAEPSAGGMTDPSVSASTAASGGGGVDGDSEPSSEAGAAAGAAITTVGLANEGRGGK